MQAAVRWRWVDVRRRMTSSSPASRAGQPPGLRERESALCVGTIQAVTMRRLSAFSLLIFLSSASWGCAKFDCETRREAQTLAVPRPSCGGCLVLAGRDSATRVTRSGSRGGSCAALRVYREIEDTKKISRSSWG